MDLGAKDDGREGESRIVVSKIKNKSTTAYISHNTTSCKVFSSKYRNCVGSCSICGMKVENVVVAWL